MTDRARDVETASPAEELPRGSAGREQLDQEERPLTQQQVQALLDKQKQEILSRVQSQDDKRDYRMQLRLKQELGQVDADLKELEAQGVTITPEQAEKLRQSRTRRVLTEVPEEPKPGTKPTADTRQREQPAGPTVDPRTQAVAATALAVMERQGVMIEKADPEFALIDQETDDPAEFVASVKKAAIKKAERLGVATDEEESEAASARRPTGGRRRQGTGTKLPAGAGAMELFRMGYRNPKGRTR